MDSDLVEGLVSFDRNSSSSPKPQSVFYVVIVYRRCSKALFIEIHALFVDLLLFFVHLIGMVEVVIFDGWVSNEGSFVVRTESYYIGKIG